MLFAYISVICIVIFTMTFLEKFHPYYHFLYTIYHNNIVVYFILFTIYEIKMYIFEWRLFLVNCTSCVNWHGKFCENLLKIMKNLDSGMLNNVPKSGVMNSMQTCNSVTFYFMKNSFSDVSRKRILPNMIRAVNQSQFTPKMKANAVSRLLSSLVWIDQYYKCYWFPP